MVPRAKKNIIRYLCAGLQEKDDCIYIFLMQQQSMKSNFEFLFTPRVCQLTQIIFTTTISSKRSDITNRFHTLMQARVHVMELIWKHINQKHKHLEYLQRQWRVVSYSCYVLQLPSDLCILSWLKPSDELYLLIHRIVLFGLKLSSRMWGIY